MVIVGNPSVRFFFLTSGMSCPTHFALLSYLLPLKRDVIAKFTHQQEMPSNEIITDTRLMVSEARIKGSRKKIGNAEFTSHGYHFIEQRRGFHFD